MRKILERSVMLSLLLGSSMCNLTFAEDVDLEQKNLHFINDYNKTIDGDLDINLTTTGSTFNNSKNYDKDNFNPNEGTITGYNTEEGKALVLWDNSSLTVNKNVNVSVIPEKWGGVQQD